jgi:hypothetical protein
MVPPVGDPDLSSSQRPARRGGLVIFPAAGGLEVPRRPAAAAEEPGAAAGVLGLLAAWRVFIVTLLIGACVVIAVALILGARGGAPTAPALPPPAPAATPVSSPHP